MVIKNYCPRSSSTLNIIVHKYSFYKYNKFWKRKNQQKRHVRNELEVQIGSGKISRKVPNTYTVTSEYFVI